MGSDLYDHVSDILDSYYIPSVDCLFSPTFNSSVLNQIRQSRVSAHIKHDEKLASVRRTMLNIIGPFCCLRNTLPTDSAVTKGES